LRGAKFSSRDSALQKHAFNGTSTERRGAP
jgi:hypothetical protein